MARLKLGEMLVQRGVIDAPTLKRALGEQIRFAGQKLKLGQILVEMQVCTWPQVCAALGEQQGFPFADLAQLAIDDEAVKQLPLDVAEKWHAAAFHREAGPPEHLDVAFADPADMVAVDAVRLRVGRRLRVHLGAPDAIQALLDRVYRGIAPASAAVEVGDDLFSDEGGELAVEHYEPGSLQLPDFDPPAPETSNGPAISLDNDFDQVFGRPSTPVPAGGASSAVGLGDPFAGMGLSASPPTASVPLHVPAFASEYNEPLTPRAEITHFPDRRPRTPTPPPAPPPAKPTLVLTSDALFGPATEPDGSASEGAEPLPELAGEVLSGEEVVDMAEASLSAEADAAALADGEGRALFGSSYDGSEHPDPMHPVDLAEPDGGALFGAPFQHEPASEPLEIDPTEPLPELAMPSTSPSLRAAPPEPELVEDVELDELMPEPAAQAAPAEPVSAPEPAAAPEPEPELIDIFDDVPGEPEQGAAPLTETSIEAESPPELPELPGLGAVPPPPMEASQPHAGAVPPPPAEPVLPPLDLVPPAPKLPTPPKVEVPKPAPKREAGVPATAEKWSVVSKAKADGEADARAPDSDLASFADRPLTPEELSVIETIEQLADGAIEEPAIKQAKPAHMIAALVRLLIRRGLIQETEFLDELTRK